MKDRLEVLAEMLKDRKFQQPQSEDQAIFELILEELQMLRVQHDRMEALFRTLRML